MKLTNTVGSRDWLAAIENLHLEISTPRNFVQGELILSTGVCESQTTGRLDRTLIEQQLSAYIHDVAGSEEDIDTAFESAAIESWLNSNNETDTE